jgi:transposase-like protein
MSVLTELKNRGIEDILIACMDGLSGFPEAVRSVFPEIRIQLCMRTLVRLRQVTKNRLIFPTDDAIFKILYLAIQKYSDRLSA